MSVSRSQYLFAYGTLRTEEIESGLHGPKRLSTSAAKAPGRLYILKEGYPILLIEPGNRIATASHKWESDWEKACAKLAAGAFRFTSQPSIEGELIEIPWERGVFDRPDSWEGFSIGSNSVYQRMAVPVLRADGVILPAWAYGCTKIPDLAIPFDGNRWIRPEGL